MNLLDGVPADYVRERLDKAGGNEIASGKFNSSESSAALAVNAFAWFHDHPYRLPPFPGLDAGYPAQSVDVEYCARFPWSGGRHPWLDATAVTATHLIGIESKRYEPFRDAKTSSFSKAYNRKCWGEHMGPFEDMRDRLNRNEISFIHLDAVQLVKHAFGLVTQARKQGRRPILVYLYAEPVRLGARMLTEAHQKHRQEIAEFASAVAGAEVVFHAASYAEWLATWPETDSELTAHRERLNALFLSNMTAAEFLKRRAGNAKPEDMLYFLDRAGNEPPIPGDEID